MTSDAKLAEALRKLRDHGSHIRYQQEGIATGIHYPTPIHLQPACSKYGYIRGMLPRTEAVTARIVSLPMYAELTIEQTQKGVNVVKKSILSGIAGL